MRPPLIEKLQFLSFIRARMHPSANASVLKSLLAQ